MVFIVHFLSPLEHRLPSWFASSRLQWLCWTYALWQLVRTNMYVLWFLSFIPHLLRVILWRKRDIVFVFPLSVVAGIRDGAARDTLVLYNSEDEEEAFWQEIHRSTTFKVVPREQRRKWPSSWRAVMYKGWYYFTSEQALRRMAYWLHLCSYQEHNLIFAEYREWGLVAENISRDDAYRKILSGDYCVNIASKKEGNLRWLTVVTWIKHVEVNQIWWGGLSIIPPLLQVWGLNGLSNALTVIIILIDFNRSLLHSLYDSLFLRFRIWVKSTLPPLKYPGITCFVLGCFTMFSRRWRPTFLTAWAPPPSGESIETLEASRERWKAFIESINASIERLNAWGNVAGKSIKLFNFSKVKDLEDVNIDDEDGGSYAYAEYRDAGEPVVCIQGRSGFVVPWCKLQPFTYANATVKTDIFVE